MATVKIEIATVIEALEQTLNKLHTDYAKQDTLEKEYQLAYETWRKELIAFAVKHIDEAFNIRTNYKEWNNTLNIDYDIKVSEGDFSKEPTRNYEIIREYEYKDKVAEITKELRILRMTKDEYVSASTLKSIGQWL